MIRIAITLILATAALAAPALADDGATSKARAKEEAEKLFRAGERAFDAGRYGMAAEAFERAYEVLPLPAITFSAAQAYRLEYFKVRDNAWLKRAVELYRRYIETQKEGGRIQDAVANLAELEPILARAESRGTIGSVVRAERTSLVLSSPVRGARGSVGGGELRPLPVDIEVEPGRHRVKIVAEGHEPFEREVDLVSGQMRAVEGELAPLPAKLAIRATAGASIHIDGRQVGTAPLGRPLAIPAGSHLVAITRRGHRPFTRQIVAGRGETASVAAELETTRQRKLAWGFVIGSGTLVAGATVAGVVALGANGSAADLDDRRQREGLSPAELDEYRELRDRRDGARTAATGLLISAAVLGAAGGLLYFLDHPGAGEGATPEGRGEALIVSPVVGGGRGLALGGRF
jgi:hypothetical protein